MSNLVQFVTVDGVPCWVRPEQVALVTPSGSGAAILSLLGGNITIRGRAEDVAGLLDRAVLALPVSALNLSVRAENALTGRGILTVGQLVCHSTANLLKTRNFGRVSMREVQTALQSRGLTLASPGGP